ncbi:HNH endonuclease signature motif containing protein [Ornithinimicrobium sufpigmenti]|uniref:HNH endonuclease signature motif containing protein n=1 Tax=Ornithinimicrobium sufpigmenti TaxID=2508882 RepID=UPI001035816E|nr:MULTISPECIES: HNH endonuclease signature motif containing protein [unclassified Ornithinimicrobium]
MARLLSVTESGLAARLIETARAVVFACGDEALVLKGFTSVAELTPAQVRKWRAEAKADAVAELQVCTGRGAEECRHLVALACAPAQVRALVIGALDSGVASWRQVQAFWRRCARLDTEGAVAVAEAMFGEDPSLMAKERLDPDGEPTTEPWQHQRYSAALEREATAVEGVDVEAERARRRAAYAARRVSMTADEDGTGTITISSDLIRVCGAYARLDRAARLMRKAGDERSLDQLRSDIATILLVHGHVPLPDDHPHTTASTPENGEEPDRDVLLDDLWSPAHEEQLAQVLSGMPTITLQVITPWDSLTGTAACRRCGHGHDLDLNGQASTPPPPEVQESSVPVAGPGTVKTDIMGGRSRVVRGQVGHILGAHGRPGAFITPGQVRELALTPGTTLHRLLTDPADGRLIERTIKAYRPDAEMRRQVIAADVLARVPWSTHPASVCELDHVVPWTGEEGGGPTTETNLAALPIRPHQAKTNRKHAAIINDRRDLTWTTLLAQSTPTRVHDYTQYLSQVRASLDEEEFPATMVAGDIAYAARGAYREGAHLTIARREQARADQHGHPVPDWATLRSVPDPAKPSRDLPAALLDTTDPQAREALRDLASQALYAALATRGPEATLQDLDDLPGATEHGGDTGGWMFVTHRRDGIRRPGPAPEHPTPEQLLDTDPSYYHRRPLTRHGRPGAGMPQDRPWASDGDYGPPPF